MLSLRGRRSLGSMLPGFVIVNDLTVAADVLDEIYAPGTRRILYGHCQQLTIFELGTVPSDFMIDIHDLYLGKTGAEIREWVELESSEATIIDRCQGQDFEVSDIGLPDQDLPIHGHLYYVIADAQYQCRCRETFQEYQGNIMIVWIVGIRVVQYREPQIIDLIGQCVKVIGSIFESQYQQNNLLVMITLYTKISRCQAPDLLDP